MDKKFKYVDFRLMKGEEIDFSKADIKKLNLKTDVDKIAKNDFRPKKIKQAGTTYINLNILNIIWQQL